VSRAEPVLTVALLSPGARVSDQQVATLVSAKEEIVELNLANGGLGNAQLARIAELTKLNRLMLQSNAIDDAGVRMLAPLRELKVLNLYGNAGVTDASVPSLAALPALEHLYLWQTRISPAGVAELKRQRPQLVIDTGDPLTPAAANDGPKT